MQHRFTSKDFDAPDAHFSSVMLRSKKLENLEKKVKTVKELIKTKQGAMELSQIHRSIELCMREITLRFEINL
jgi:hypothetical protein